MEAKTIQYDKIFRALGDVHRIQILDLLMEQERNAGELLQLVDVVQSTLSHHMKSLCDSGLVTARKEGKWTYYSISRETVMLARAFLKKYQEDAEEQKSIYASMRSEKKKKAERSKKEAAKKKDSGKKKEKKDTETKKDPEKKKSGKKKK